MVNQWKNKRKKHRYILTIIDAHLRPISEVRKWKPVQSLRSKPVKSLRSELFSGLLGGETCVVVDENRKVFLKNGNNKAKITML